MLPRLPNSAMEYCRWITFIFLVVYAKVVTAVTRVSLTAPVNPVKEGGMMALHCKVSEPSDDQSVTIYRWIGQQTKSETISWQDDILNSVDDRAYLAKRVLSDGSAVYFLSITDITRADQGKYSCEVLERTATGLGTVAVDSVTVNVQYFPTNPYPECASNSPTKILSGTDIVLNCSSEQGFPNVSLTWTRAGTREAIKSTAVQVNSQGMSFSELRLRVSLADEDAVFLCQMKSAVFPKRVESCHIGPLVVIPNPLATPIFTPDEDSVYQEPNSPLGEVVTIAPATDRYPDSVDDKLRCQTICSNITTNLSIWRIATVIASAIALLLLVIAITIYVKIHKETTSNHKMEIRRRSQLHLQYATTRQPIDCVYEELKYRQDGEGNKVYMALVRPRKPDSLAVPVTRNVDVEGNYTLTPTTLNNNNCQQNQL